ncbi:MAG: hypothetical protein FWE09_09860 [Treponema sp.]|nr:hypothetical protein [Treponema sp.]
MPLLQVRDFPAELYEKISRAAAAENRSVPQQTIVLLKNALAAGAEPRTRRQAALREINGFNVGGFKAEGSGAFPDPARMIREDRDR